MNIEGDKDPRRAFKHHFRAIRVSTRGLVHARRASAVNLASSTRVAVEFGAWAVASRCTRQICPCGEYNRLHSLRPRPRQRRKDRHDEQVRSIRIPNRCRARRGSPNRSP